MVRDPFRMVRGRAEAGTRLDRSLSKRELVVFTKDVEKGRRIVAIAEVDARRRWFSMSSMTSTITRNSCRT